MSTKPDDTTWEEYAYGDNNKINDERGEHFVDEVGGEVKEALDESDELDAGRYELYFKEKQASLTVWSDGWEMDVDEVLRLRDELRDHGVGDESVAVVCNSRSTEEEVYRGELPDRVPRGVVIELWARVHRGDELVKSIHGDLNEVMETASY